MIRINQLIVAAVCALPLIASAQTSTGTPSSMEKAPSPNIKPADQPRTQLEKDATTKNGQASKYGGPGTDAGSATGGTMGKDDTAASKMKRKAPTSGTPPVGDVPTYPAPAKDGTPTK